MITYILNAVFLLWVLIESWKQKRYPYIAAATMVLLYFIFDVLQNNYDLVENAQIFSWIQKTALIVLAVYLIYVLLKSNNRKAICPVAAFAVAACVCRILRTVIFNHNIEAMKIQAYDIFQRLRVYYTIADSTTRLMLLLMLFCIAWQLGKPVATNS